MNCNFVSPGKQYFSFNLKYLFLVGLWPHIPKWLQNNMHLYKIYEITLHILSVGYLIIASIGTYDVRDDIVMVMSNLDKTLIGYCYVYKVLFYELHRGEMEMLISDITNSGDQVTKQVVDNMANLLIFVTTVVSSIVGAFSLAAFCEGEMTVVAWMPFDPKESTMNLLMAAQIIALLFLVPCALRGMGIQGIVCSVVMYFCEQLKEIQSRIRSLEYSPERDAEFREAFIHIINKHVRLIGYRKAMEDSFNQFFFIHNLAITVELCLNALMIGVVGTEQKKMLITFLAFLGIALLNTYIHCYLGNEMVIQSEGIALAVYETQWTSWPTDMQKNLLIVIRISQKPLKLTAGGIAMVSLQTYCQILYNGYSIFAMLHDMM